MTNPEYTMQPNPEDARLGVLRHKYLGDYCHTYFASRREAGLWQERHGTAGREARPTQSESGEWFVSRRN
jgi:hypothetical protein